MIALRPASAAGMKTCGGDQCNDPNQRGQWCALPDTVRQGGLGVGRDDGAAAGERGWDEDLRSIRVLMASQ
jgi:hypothetical protein